MNGLRDHRQMKNWTGCMGVHVVEELAADAVQGVLAADEEAAAVHRLRIHLLLLQAAAAAAAAAQAAAAGRAAPLQQKLLPAQAPARRQGRHSAEQFCRLFTGRRISKHPWPLNKREDCH